MHGDIGKVAAVLLTYRRPDISEILKSCSGLCETRIWSNDNGPNISTFGRFLGACHLVQQAEIVYMQDDDCVTDPSRIIELWEPGTILCNMGTAGHANNYVNRLDKLMGFGCVFEKSLIVPTFERYFKHFELDEVLTREAGRIFTGLNHEIVRTCAVTHVNLPWAYESSRMYRQENHAQMSDQALNRVKHILQKERQ